MVALTIWLGTSAVFLALTGLGTRVAPFFGVLLAGWPAVLFWLVMAGLMSGLVRPIYRMQPAGWWGTLVLTAAGLVSSGVTFSVIDLSDLLHANRGISASEARLIEPAFSAMIGPMVGLGIFWAAAFLVFVIWIRGYFLGSSNSSSASSW